MSVSIAAKMLEKMRENQKRHFQNRRSTHTFKIGDLVCEKNLKWEPNYRIVKLPSAWTAVVENQISRKVKGVI